MLENVRKDRQEAWDKLQAANEERHQGWDRLKSLKDTRIAFSEKGKAFLATAVVAPAVFENIHLPGNMGLGLSGAAILFSVLQGDKAFSVGRWIKEKLVADSALSLVNDASLLKDSDASAGKDSVPSVLSGNDALDEMTQQNRQRTPREVSIAREFRVQGDISLSGHPENETLRLGVDVKKDRRFDPWINDLFGKGMIVAAVQGSGKSMLCGLIIEQAAKCGVPAIVFDHKGEYSGIVDLPYVNGLRAGSNRLRSKLDCFELSVDNADDFVQMVMQERYQAIVHLPSYGDGWLDRAEVVAAVGNALMRYAAYQRECEIPLIPCLVFQDEAQLYIPQDPRMLPPEARKNSDILDTLNNAYFALVSNGRSNGYTMCFATPSLTYVAKAMIKSCQVKVLMRHVEKNDLDMCEQIVNGAATRDEIESMPVGTGIVFGFTPKPVAIKFDKRQSRDLSETPGIERLRQPMSSDVKTALLPETMEEAQQRPSHMSRSSSPRLHPTLAEALRLYNEEGCITSRPLATKMGVGKDTANGYLQQLRTRKLIV